MDVLTETGAFEQGKAYPLLRAEILFLTEVGERAWLASEHPRAAS